MVSHVSVNYRFHDTENASTLPPKVFSYKPRKGAHRGGWRRRHEVTAFLSITSWTPGFACSVIEDFFVAPFRGLSLFIVLFFFRPKRWCDHLQTVTMCDLNLLAEMLTRIGSVLRHHTAFTTDGISPAETPLYLKLACCKYYSSQKYRLCCTMTPVSRRMHP